MAVIGGRVAESVIGELTALGFGGDIWPVHPERSEMAGLACYATVGALPHAPDAAFVAVNRTQAVTVIGALSALGAGGAVCHASGYAEAGGDGAPLNDALIRAAGDMPVLGPNCWGYLNLLDKVAMWPGFHGALPVPRGVAIISQSGNVAINLTMQQRGLEIAMMVNPGNQTLVDANGLIEAFLDDERISAIGLNVEGLSDIARFSELALRAQHLGKPIVVLKTGRSAQARQAAISHTATLAGADALYDALFARCGVARAQNLSSFLEILKFFHVCGPLKGNSIATMSCSGGEACLAADAVLGTSLEFGELSAAATHALRASLGELVTIANPLDYHTFVWGNRDAMQSAFAAMMGGGFDLTALILDVPRRDRTQTAEYDMALDAWAAAAKMTGATTAVIATLPEGLREDHCTALAKQGICGLCGLGEALAAIDAAAFFGAGGAAVPVVRQRAHNLLPGQRITTMEEAEAKLRLAAFGLPVPAAIVAVPENAPVAAHLVGFPVAMKAQGLTHKSEAGGVILNIRNQKKAAKAARHLGRLSDHVVVEEMIGDGVCELIAGLARDDQFGLYLVAGAGGVEVELMQDSRVLLLPAGRGQILRALKSLRIWPLLEGYRGQPPGDVEAVIDAIEVVARFGLEFADTLMELDINPLIVRPRGKGVAAADVLIREVAALEHGEQND